MAFLIGIRDKSALFNKDQMDCHTITTMVACNLMVLLFRRNLPMPDTPLKNNSDQQTERHSQALMLVIQDWAAADTAWVNAGTFFSAAKSHDVSFGHGSDSVVRPTVWPHNSNSRKIKKQIKWQ